MLAEMLIAAAIVLTLLGTAMRLVDPARGGLGLQPHVAEVHQRLRAVAVRLQGDLMMAGSGPHPTVGTSLSWLRAPVVPALIGHRHAPDSGTTFTSDAITMLYAPPRTARGLLASGLAGSPALVRLAPGAAGCATGSGRATCGFVVNSLALVFDADGRSDIFRITQVHDDALWLRTVGGGTPLRFGPGDVIIPLELRSYYLDHASAQLRVQDGWVADFPLLDDVVALSIRYFGRTTRPPKPRGNGVVAPCLATMFAPAPAPALRVRPETELDAATLTDGPWCGGRLHFDVDLFRVSRVRIEIRLQVSADSRRGQNRSLFTFPGSGRPGRVVPDLTGVVEVSPRGAPGV